MENQLGRETSPYLKQHADNPVAWQSWSAETLALARREDKPIFLSIGYSTCHWCHVMERECFEDPDIAALLNAGFIPVKVDREERPDIDSIYMSALQQMTGSGGWPLNIFLTPELEPFYGGTYFPPRPRLGLASFPDVLQSVAATWENDRDRVTTTAARLTETIKLHALAQTPKEAPTPGLLDDARDRLLDAFDDREGGFGGAPKFPPTMKVNFLLRRAVEQSDSDAGRAALFTLDKMAAGGIRDHLAGGFHRYSTDEYWHVPHFEKMLYDQALIAGNYLHAYAMSGDKSYAAVARGICDYVLDYMTDETGGFHSAEDADSEGEEGLFYLWTPAQTKALLGEEAALFNEVYDITKGGNYELGRSIPRQTVSLESRAADAGLEQAEFEQRLGAAHAKLLEARDTRIRPGLDDKVLTSWNGMMITALAAAGTLLDEPRYLAAAEKAADFIAQRLNAGGELLHGWAGGRPMEGGLLEDYAFFARGLLDMFEAGGAAKNLRLARELADTMIERFYDDEDGGFFQTEEGAADLLYRHKDLFDGATPAASSAALEVLLRLGHLTGEPRFTERADTTLNNFGFYLRRAPEAFSHVLGLVHGVFHPRKEVVIAGDPADPETAAMETAARRSPRRPLVLVVPADGADNELAELIPWLALKKARGGRPTAYVCEFGACDAPVHTAAELQTLLG